MDARENAGVVLGPLPSFDYCIELKSIELTSRLSVLAEPYLTEHVELSQSMLQKGVKFLCVNVQTLQVREL